MKKTYYVERCRAKTHDELSYRATGARIKSPASLDREKRSLELVIASETPVPMYDWETGETVPEVLLAKGAVMPAQVPLLDTHSRWSTGDVLGSVRNKRIEEGGLVTGTAFFSSTPKAEETFTKYEEGHLTDFSAGYRFSRNSVTKVKKGEKVEIDGRTWKGPVNVVTSWTIKEVSCCPIGADARAKARSDQPFNDNHKEHNMDPKLRAFLESLGLRSDATEEEAWEFYNNQKNRAQGGTDNALVGKLNTLIRSLEPLAAKAAGERQFEDTEEEIQKMRDDAQRRAKKQIADERKRIQEISATCSRMTEKTGIDFLDLENEMINDGTTVADAYKRCLDRIAAAKPADLTTGVRVSITKEERDKSREAAVDGLLIRAGLALGAVRDQKTEYQNFTLYELAKNRMAICNVSAAGLDKIQVFQRALSSSDFANILADVANKGILDGFQKANETYDAWVDTTGRVNDFKPHVFARASEAPSLVAINPNDGEYTFGQMSDTKETVTVTKLGRLVKFTHELMVNDDLGALTDIRDKMGQAARRKYGDLCYAVLTGNPAMGDGNNLFDASNHANHTDSGAAPAVAGLNTAAAAMATQKDLEGEQNLNIIPQFILAPWALKGTVDNLLTTTTPTAPGSAASPVMNPWAYLTRIYDARLDANSVKAWYLAAMKGLTVRLFTMNGNIAPNLDSKADFYTDGMIFKVNIIAAAKAVDYRGLYKNDGE